MKDDISSCRSNMLFKTQVDTFYILYLDSSFKHSYIRVISKFCIIAYLYAWIRKDDHEL